MKRAFYVVALLFFALFLAGQVMAQGSPAQAGFDKEAFQKALDLAKEVHFTGTVVSHDPMCHCVVLNTAKGELTLLDDYAKFMQEYDQAKGLKVGAQVKGVYKTVKHIHYITSISYE
jgi:hypothetical protein